MIIFPECTDYQTAYTEPSCNCIVEFTVFDNKTNEIETSVKFHLCSPMTNQEVYNYCNSRIPNDIRNKILLGVRDYEDLEDNKLTKLSIWKLDWFCRNITERKIICIIPEGYSRIAINPYDEKEIEKLVKTLKDLAK